MAFEYFTLNELRALPDVSNVTTYPDARCDAAAAYVVATIERVVGTSFIPRTFTETHDGGDGSMYGLALGQPFVRSVTSATETGIGVVSPNPVDIDQSGVLFKFATGATLPTPWAYGRANVVVVYTAGYSDTVPADIKEAALYATRQRLIQTSPNAGQSTRRTRLTTSEGSFDLAVPDDEEPFGMPEIDAVITGYRKRLEGAAQGFA